jgi:CheY-like chemotaxis protein
MGQSCLIVDDDLALQDLLSDILDHLGADSRSCADLEEMRANIAAHAPAMIFLDIGLKSADAMDAFHQLVAASYQGKVQLLSGRGQDVLEAVQRAGTDLGLRMRPPLAKPFQIESIRQVLDEEGLLAREEGGGGILATTDFEPLNSVSMWCKAWLSVRDDTLAHVETGIRSGGIAATGRGLQEAPPDSARKLLSMISWCIANLDTCAAALARIRAPASFLLHARMAHLRQFHIPSLFAAEELRDRTASLTLAFSEDDLFEDLAAAREMMIHLRIQGVRLRVVHAGTRFLSIAGYQNLPVQEVIVDPQFTRGDRSPSAQRRLAKIVEIAQRSGATVLSPEIDGEEDLKLCADAGFDWYERSTPPRVLPASEFARRWSSSAEPDRCLSWRTVPITAIGQMQQKMS